MEWLSISTTLVAVATGSTADAASLILSAFRRRACLRGAFSMNLLVTRQGRKTLPGREEIEMTPILCELDRLVDHRLAVLVVTDLDIAGQREILAQRMT